MVVCKFFQEGYCRYGQNCRFEHVYGSKYSYHANAPPQAAPQAPSGVTDEQLMQQVQSDVQSALKGRQWILSCYSPFKEKPVFPGISDLSPEEARLFMYEAKANNSIEQAVAYMNNLTKENRSKYEQLLTNSPNIVKVLRSLYKGETPASPFNGQMQNAFGQQPNQTNASSIFRSALQTQTASPFGQNTAQSLFAQANTAHTPDNVFKGFGQDKAQSIFSQATQSVFGAQPAPNQSPFGAADPAKSLFAQANNAPPTQPFKSPFEQPSPFAQSANSNTFQKTEPGSVFGQAANPFQQAPADDPGVYSNIKDLTQDDIDMFNSDSFKLGFIPEMPPPQTLCL